MLYITLKFLLGLHDLHGTCTYIASTVDLQCMVKWSRSSSLVFTLITSKGVSMNFQIIFQIWLKKTWCWYLGPLLMTASHLGTRQTCLSQVKQMSAIMHSQSHLNKLNGKHTRTPPHYIQNRTPSYWGLQRYVIYCWFKDICFCWLQPVEFSDTDPSRSWYTYCDPVRSIQLITMFTQIFIKMQIVHGLVCVCVF